MWQKTNGLLVQLSGEKVVGGGGVVLIIGLQIPG